MTKMTLRLRKGFLNFPTLVDSMLRTFVRIMNTSNISAVNYEFPEAGSCNKCSALSALQCLPGIRPNNFWQGRVKKTVKKRSGEERSPGSVSLTAFHSFVFEP